MQTHRSISLSTIVKIIRGDYAAFLASVAPLVAWVLFLIQRDTDLVTFAIVATVVCIPLAIARVYWVTRILRTGEEVPATVTFIEFRRRRDRGYMKYSYTYRDQTYESGTAIMRTKATAGLEPGDEIALIVDSNNPKRALPKAQYIQE